MKKFVITTNDRKAAKEIQELIGSLGSMVDAKISGDIPYDSTRDQFNHLPKDKRFIAEIVQFLKVYHDIELTEEQIQKIDIARSVFRYQDIESIYDFGPNSPFSLKNADSDDKKENIEEFLESVNDLIENGEEIYLSLCELNGGCWMCPEDGRGCT